MIHKTLDSHQFENPESRPPLGEKLFSIASLPMDYKGFTLPCCVRWDSLCSASPQRIGVDSPFPPSALFSSTEPPGGNLYVTRPASPRPDWGLIWFGFWLFFSVFIGWRSVVLFFRVITATSNPKTLKRGSKSSPNFVFLIQRTGCPPQNWRGKSASLISVCWTCA